LKRPLSTNPSPDAIYESASGKDLLEELRLIAARRWEPPCKFDAPSTVVFEESQDTLKPKDSEVIRKSAAHIARRRGIPRHVGLEVVETAGFGAFCGAVSYGIATADDNFDVRAFALDKARLAMDAAARRTSFITEVQAVPYDMTWNEAILTNCAKATETNTVYPGQITARL
jgi:hypothetical protein